MARTVEPDHAELEVLDSYDLSTGETIDLPISLEMRGAGAVFTADHDLVSGMVPDGLSPINATPWNSAINLGAVEYERVGDDVMEPYNEYGVSIPVTTPSEESLPLVSVLRRATSGYVWYLPVTTEPAKAFGVEVWGYPKEVADISHDIGADTWRTSVSSDRGHFVTMDVDKPPTFSIQQDASSYTVKEDEVMRVPGEVTADVGFWPYTDDVSFEFGDHPRAEAFLDLDVSQRALFRYYIDGEMKFWPGEPVQH